MQIGDNEPPLRTIPITIVHCYSTLSAVMKVKRHEEFNHYYHAFRQGQKIVFVSPKLLSWHRTQNICYSSRRMKTSGTVAMILHHKGSVVWSVCPSATVFEAIALLAEKNIGALPVMEDGILIAIFSERDYTRKVALEGKSSRELQVRQIISAPVISVTPQHSIEDCLRIMSEKHVRHLPVLEGAKVVGMISIGDLVNWVISAQNCAIDQMAAYIAGR
jgi:CBS domain-containing protein